MLEKTKIAEYIEDHLQTWLDRLEEEHGHDFASMAGWLYGQTDWATERIEREVPRMFRLKAKGVSDFAALGAIEAGDYKVTMSEKAREEYALSHGF